MADGYRYNRKFGGDSGGSLIVGAFTGQTTLLVCGFKKQNCIHLQRLHIHISQALAGQTWSVQDSAGVLVTGQIPVAAAPTQDPIAAEYDFGPKGFILTQGADLVFVPSAIGAIGDITWDAYQELPAGVPALP